MHTNVRQRSEQAAGVHGSTMYDPHACGSPICMIRLHVALLRKSAQDAPRDARWRDPETREHKAIVKKLV